MSKPYYIFNKVLKTRHTAKDLTLMFNPFKAISVCADIKRCGKYEDDFYVVTIK